MSEAEATIKDELVEPLPDYQPAAPESSGFWDTGLGSARQDKLNPARIKFGRIVKPPARTKSATIAGRDGRAGYTCQFAPLEEIVKVVQMPLAEAELGFRQFLRWEDGRAYLRTILFHAGGQWSGNDYPIYADASRGAQVFQSGVTYARRQGLSLELGLAAVDDDDANVADALPATIADLGPVVAPTRPVTRAHPLKAESPDPRDPVRTAFRRVQQAIDTSDAPAALLDIYDVQTGQWGALFDPELATIRSSHPEALVLLQRRVHARLGKLRGSPVAPSGAADE